MTDICNHFDTFILLCLEKSNNDISHDLCSEKEPDLSMFNLFVDNPSNIFADSVISYLDEKKSKDIYGEIGSEWHYRFHNPTMTHVYLAEGFTEEEARLKLQEHSNATSKLVKLDRDDFFYDTMKMKHEKLNWFSRNGCAKLDIPKFSIGAVIII